MAAEKNANIKSGNIPYSNEGLAAETKTAQEQQPKAFDLGSLEIPILGPSKPKSSKIDFAALAIPQTFDIDQPVEQYITQVKLGRPNPQGFVRFHPTFAKTFFAVQMKEERETYLVTNKELWSIPDVARELKRKTFFLYTTRDHSYGLWEVAASDASDKFNNWASSSMNVIRYGREKWVRILTVKGSGYKAEVAPGILNEPKWPKISDEEILELAFSDRLIDSLDHPILRKLRGME